MSRCSALLVAVIGAGSLLAACSDETGTSSTGSPSSVAASSSSSAGAGGAGEGGAGQGGAGQGGGNTGQGGSGGAGCVTPDATTLAKFDPMKGELPEGLAIDGTTAYVGFAGNGKIVKVALPGGLVTDFGFVNAFMPMKTNLLGVALDKSKNVYVGLSGNPADAEPGIYKMQPAGGAAFKFAQTAEMTFPNGLVFDAAGNLFVSDSASGTIFKITSSGLSVTAWTKDPLLVGDIASPCASGLGVPLGANGLVLSNGAFYVTNTDKASIVKIPVKADGTPGTAVLFAGPDCKDLKGLDGLTVDMDGSLIVAANSQNKILRVSADGQTITPLLTCDSLSFPASVAISMNGADRNLIITNASFFGMPQTPGLLSLPLGK